MVAAGAWPVLIVSGSVWLVFAVLFFGDNFGFSVGHVTQLCGQAPLDVRFTSSASEVDRFLAACGPDGRAAYRDMQIADLFYPAVVGVFMASALAASLGRLTSRRRMVAAAATVPLLGSMFDYGENALAWSALAAYPEPTRTSSLLGMASAIKTGLFWLAGVVLVLAMAALLARVGRRALTGGGVPAGGRAVLSPEPAGSRGDRSVAKVDLDVGAAR